jgi:hypothetical protein
MKNIFNHKHLVLGALALSSALGLTQMAEAAPSQHAPAWGYRDNNNRPGRIRDRRPARPLVQTFTGKVTKIRTGDSFDISVGSKNYNVYTASRLPRRLDKGDVVQVSGVRTGDNDISNATVSLVRNR